MFFIKGRLIYILHLQNCPFSLFMTSQSDVNDTLTLRYLFCFWRDLVHFNVRKELYSLRKLSLLSSSKIIKDSIKIAMKCNICGLCLFGHILFFNLFFFSKQDINSVMYIYANRIV